MLAIDRFNVFYIMTANWRATFVSQAVAGLCLQAVGSYPEQASPRQALRCLGECHNRPGPAALLLQDCAGPQTAASQSRCHHAMVPQVEHCPDKDFVGLLLTWSLQVSALHRETA